MGPPMRWMKRICDRMDKLGISPTDDIYVAAQNAYNALHSLGVRSHYRSCESGVGEPPAMPQWRKAMGSDHNATGRTESNDRPIGG